MREGSQTEEHKRGRGYRPVIDQPIKPIPVPTANTVSNKKCKLSGLATQSVAPLVPNSKLHPTIKKVELPKQTQIIHDASNSKLNMNSYLFTQGRRNHL